MSATRPDIEAANLKAAVRRVTSALSLIQAASSDVCTVGRG